MESENKSNNFIWLTWENHRRSKELASEFQAEYIVLTSKSNQVVRYIKLSARTIYVVFQKKPRVIFCQNPSIILNLLLCFLKPLLGFRLVSDRHTNFKFKTYRSCNPKWVLFRMISHFTIRHSDFVIVTNQFLKDFVECIGGQALVLPDKLPDIKSDEVDLGATGCSAIFVCTFSDDEPFNELIEAASHFKGRLDIYITGNYRKKFDDRPPRFSNVHFLGHVSEADYVSYMSSTDFVIVLTDMDYTLNCGSYEAVSLRKPMVLGDTRTIRSYFYKGAVYSSLDVGSLKNALECALVKIDKLTEEASSLKDEIEEKWPKRFVEVKQGVFARKN